MLHHVGVSAAFPMARRAELLDELAPLREDAVEATRGGWATAAASAAGRGCPAGVSRWNGKKDLSWEPLRPELGGRGRLRRDGGRPVPAHRPVRPLAAGPDPRSCTYDQLERPVRFDVDQVLAG